MLIHIKLKAACLALFALVSFQLQAQDMVHEKQTIQAVKHSPSSFKQMEEFDRLHPNARKPFVVHNNYSAKNDTAINTLEKINKRIPGFKKVAPTGNFIERRNAGSNKSLLQAGGGQQKASAITGACVSYEMLGDAITSYPPDVSSAGGFDHTIVTLNSEVRIKQKDGTTVSTVTLDAFTSATGQSDVFDPKIVYDHHSNRWIAIACCARRNASSGFVIGTTADANPSGTWQWYTVDADLNNKDWFDYPSMGITTDKVVITGNMFSNVGDTGRGGKVFVLNKTQLQAFQYPSITIFNNILFTTVPATTFGNITTCYMTAVYDGGLAQLYLYSIQGSASSPTITNQGIVDYGAGNGWWYGLGNVLPQKGSAIKLDGNDHRMMSCIYRNGKIWWANTFYWPLAAPTYAGVQYGIFTAANRVTNDLAGLWNNDTEMFAYPNITVNDDEDMGISFGYFSTSTYASAGFGFANGTSTLSGLSWNISRYGDSSYLKGFGNPIRNRWGDYFGIGLDPTDGKSIWMTGQYAAARTNGNSGAYGTYSLKLCATCTPNITTAEAHDNNFVKKYEASNTITTTAQSFSGSLIKYDAGNAVIMGPGFQARPGSFVRAFIQGCGGVD